MAKRFDEPLLNSGCGDVHLQNWDQCRELLVLEADLGNMLDWDIVVSEFKLLSRYYVPFLSDTLGKGIKPLIPSAKGRIVPQLFLYKNSFSIE